MMIRRKRTRASGFVYERDHSLWAGHIDWRESNWSDLKVCLTLDDASRMVLAGGEFSEIDKDLNFGIPIATLLVKCQILLKFAVSQPNLSYNSTLNTSTRESLAFFITSIGQVL